MTRRRAKAGVSLLEAMAAVAIVGLAIVTSTGFMMRRARVAAQVDTHVLVAEALASEMDTVLARAPASLALGEHAWTSGSDRGLRLPDVHASVRVMPLGPGLRDVRVEIAWARGRRMARERLVEVP